jgi:large subunit ribosomal protein L37Ae
MAVIKKKGKLGPTKRLGTRYGALLKQRVDVIERVQRSLQKCPACLKVRAKRQSLGIYECKSCGARFTSKAYGVTD